MCSIWDVILGMLLGMVIMFFIAFKIIEHDKDDCQELHNVYECKIVFVPVERE